MGSTEDFFFKVEEIKICLCTYEPGKRNDDVGEGGEAYAAAHLSIGNGGQVLDASRRTSPL